MVCPRQIYIPYTISNLDKYIAYKILFLPVYSILIFLQTSLKFWFKGFQKSLGVCWLFPMNWLYWWSKKLTWKKKNVHKLVKSYQLTTINLYIINIFLTWNRISLKKKKMSISKHGGAYGLPYSDTVHFTCPHPFCTVNVWMKILNDSTQAFIT